MADPIIKWAGGKRQLLNRISPLLPKDFNNYYEPFFGGGALYFNLADRRPIHGVVNDVNKSLMNMYSRVRDDVHIIMDYLEKLDSESMDQGKEFYIESRDRYNELLESDIYNYETAALLIYLNKHCFNGLYRVNKKGKFNVPYNSNTSSSFSRNNLLDVSKILKNTELLCGDFEDACRDCKKGDFIFFDSPYDVSFTKYTSDGFEKEDHIRLYNLFKKLSDMGCYCMSTNHDTELINNLYHDYRIETVDVMRNINRDGSNRTGKEIIIRNYQ